MNHYFSKNPDVESNRKHVTFTVRGISLTLMVDAGVFSKSGLDYGTRTLIEAVDLPADAMVVDLGCGYGPVTAVLGRIYPQTRWWLVDVNERACQLAALNVAEFGDKAKVYESDGFESLPAGLVDVIVLNPPIRAGKAVIYKLFEESSARLTRSGSLWVVMQKKHGAPSAKVRLEELFSDVELRHRSSGYHVFKCTGPTRDGED